MVSVGLPALSQDKPLKDLRIAKNEKQFGSGSITSGRFFRGNLVDSLKSDAQKRAHFKKTGVIPESSPVKGTKVEDLQVNIRDGSEKVIKNTTKTVEKTVQNAKAPFNRLKFLLGGTLALIVTLIVVYVFGQLFNINIGE